MKKRFFNLIALFMALFVSMQGYAQKEQQTLMLGEYETTDQMQVWDGFNLQNAPFIFTYSHSGSQVIYTAEQLASMKDKEITSLSFKCFTADDYSTYTSNAKLYLQEIDGNEFPRSESDNKTLNWVEFNEDNIVATADLNIDFMNASVNMEDVEITFDLSAKPYKYTGKSLVVTVVNDATSECPQGTIQFYWIPSKKEDPWRSLVYGSDKTDFITNQAKDITLNGNEDKWKNAPIAKFTYQEADAPVDPTPTPSNGTITLGHFDDMDTEGSWDGFNLQNAPVIFTYAHSGSQVMYTAEQLADMKDKQITSMTFKCFNEGCYDETYTSNMKLYIQEIDEAQFPYDEVSELYSWINFDENNAVAEMEFTTSPLDAYINSTDIEIKFNLSTPYVYTGKTLVVTVINDSETCIDSSNGALRFYWIDSVKEDPWKSFVFASDKITFLENQAKDNVLKGMDNEDKWKNAPAVQIAYEEPTSTGICEIATADNNSVATTNGAVVVTLSNNADVQIFSITGSNVKNANLSAGTHTFAMPGGIYVVRINNNTYKVCVNK